MTSDVHFPPISQADEDGLLMLGGDLSQRRLVEGYRRGIFPWPIVDRGVEVLSWWSPDPRAILELDQLHVPKRLARRIRRGEFQVTLNRDFEAVIRGCAEPRLSEQGTWITAPLARAYSRLHQDGLAHSVEVWHQERLVGGVYGVALGGYFTGESMFHRMRDASKVAVVSLVQRLRQQGFRLFDIQQWSPHMAQLGATEIARDQFIRRLGEAQQLAVSFAERGSAIEPDSPGDCQATREEACRY